MRRPRKFLSLIILLLVINALFFIIWYSLGGRDWLRKLITDTISNAAHIELSFGDLNISDRQIFAQDVQFAMPDSLISLSAESIRIRYNIYKFIFSGFKLEGVVSNIEILRPIASVRYHAVPKEKEYKPKSSFSIPDISGYFDRISLENGEVSVDISLPIKMIHDGDLIIEENLKNIELRANNVDSISKISFNATSSLGGKVVFEASLDKGRIDYAKASIQNFEPLYLTHPDIQDLRSEITASASYQEPADSTAAIYSANVRLRNTSAFAINKYPVSIPRINVETDGDYLLLNIPDANIAQSYLNAELRIKNLMHGMTIDGSTANIEVNMQDILPQMSGLVKANILANGSFVDPIASLKANSSRFAYQDWAFEDIELNAQFSDNLATLSMLTSRWENQNLNLAGSFDTKNLSFDAELFTTPVLLENQPFIARGNIDVKGLILSPYPLLEANIYDVNFSMGDLNLKSVNGYATMCPTDESLLFDANLSAENGFAISAVGDFLDRHISLDAKFNDLDIYELYSQDTINTLRPNVSGNLHAIMLQDKIWLRSLLDTNLEGEYDYHSEIDLVGSLDIKDMAISAALNTRGGTLFGESLDIDLAMEIQDNMLKIYSFKAEDFLSFSGRLNLEDYRDLDFDLAVYNLDTARLIQYYPDVELLIPEFQKLNLFASYNRQNSGQLSARLNFNQLDLLSIIPINLNLALDGNLEDIIINGDVNVQNRKLLTLKGESSILPEVNLDLTAAMDKLSIQDILYDPPGEATLQGSVGLAIRDVMSPDREMDFKVDLEAKDILIADFDIDEVKLRGAQLVQALVIDTLYAKTEGLFEAKASGSLDYNAITNLFYEGDSVLDVQISGELFPWLMTLTDYIQESSGKSSLALSISTQEDQFSIISGDLDIRNGYVHLKDQVEPMRNIEILGSFDENRFIIELGSFQMGNGRFYMDNIFTPDQSDHLLLSFIDFGHLRLMIEEPGIQATIPVISPPRSLTNVALRGQSSRYATIQGPFDDMKIEAYVIVSNLDILYPPGADNLLNLIMSVRGNGRKPETDPVPLPFTLDLMVRVGENVRYVTYPTNLHITPGGFLHLIYDGNRFIVQEANINSERGTIDFFGTVFEVDNIAVSMIDKQGILDINGVFFKRTPDGTTVTLTIYSTPEFDKSILDRLQISLASDNPEDQSITQVLSRLRYNQGMDDLPEGQSNNLLQDEALGLIGGNLDSSFLTPFFYPLENWVRRTLHLDGFYINAGFIQNLFSEYSSDSSQFSDMSSFISDIPQFSSSILLNNLSMTMSKYIGYRTFVDYELKLQEATDLQQKTSILVSHKASLRLVLPKQYRLEYTLNYAPQEDQRLTHEIMFKRSLRFWGL